MHRCAVDVWTSQNANQNTDNMGKKSRNIREISLKKENQVCPTWKINTKTI